MKRLRKALTLGLASLALAGLMAVPAQSHGWYNYHWPTHGRPYGESIWIDDLIGGGFSSPADWARYSWALGMYEQGAWIWPHDVSHLGTDVVGCGPLGGTIRICWENMNNPNEIAHTHPYIFPNDPSGHFYAAVIHIDTADAPYLGGGNWHARIENILCHEIGHALGVMHHDSATSCMSTRADENKIHPDTHDKWVAADRHRQND